MERTSCLIRPRLNPRLGPEARGASLVQAARCGEEVRVLERAERREEGWRRKEGERDHRKCTRSNEGQSQERGSKSRSRAGGMRLRSHRCSAGSSLRRSQCRAARRLRRGTPRSGSR
eukprot:1843791-Rhodomonas_salina.2